MRSWYKNCISLVLVAGTCLTSAEPLAYAPSPPDNPLRGLVPYSGERREVFPHSLEFNYFPLKQLMTGPDRFNWDPLDRFLEQISKRGHQAIFRVFLEYPGKASAVPDFLVDQGVQVTEWMTDNTYRGKSYTPDYADPRVRQALTRFIAALGARYDGDPRIGFITAGLLGSWGEWHTHPRHDLWAPKATQTAVLDAYEKAFQRTPILLRYPADQDANQVSNAHRPFGYHDDSFAWATLDDGREEHSWYFMALMNRAGTGDHWKRNPIGGEIRPEVWGTVFDEPSSAPDGQAFAECVRQTHVTWLMDCGMFKKDQPPGRRERALAQINRMGYEFHVSQATIRQTGDHLNLSITIRNTGSAPLYADWPVQAGLLDERDQSVLISSTAWKLTGLLPGEEVQLQQSFPAPLPQSARSAGIRVPNPMPGGHPLRFANTRQRTRGEGWLVLGTLKQ